MLGNDEKPVDSEHLKNQAEYWSKLLFVVELLYTLEASILPFLGYFLFNVVFREQLFALCRRKKRNKECSQDIVTLFASWRKTTFLQDKTSLIQSKRWALSLDLILNLVREWKLFHLILFWNVAFDLVDVLNCIGLRLFLSICHRPPSPKKEITC